MTDTPLHPPAWPELDYQAMKETVTTVQLWTQIVGKIRLRKAPRVNHSWSVTLYVSPRGLSTGSIPYNKGIFQLDFDFIDHRLLIGTSEGNTSSLVLQDRTVASFYQELFRKLEALGIQVEIWARPNEIEPCIPFAEDKVHHAYDPQQMNALWRALVKMNTVLNQFRAGFMGKCSPVHFFWGGFDLAVTRFSGRTAPLYTGSVPNMPPDVMQEAYSHEVSSAGFWPGGEAFPQPAFYSYCYPATADFGQQPVKPAGAFYSKEMGEFFLPYRLVAQSPDPEAMLMQFLETTYLAAARTGNWNREALEFTL